MERMIELRMLLQGASDEGDRCVHGELPRHVTDHKNVKYDTNSSNVAAGGDIGETKSGNCTEMRVRQIPGCIRSHLLVMPRQDSLRIKGFKSISAQKKARSNMHRGMKMSPNSTPAAGR